MVGSSSAPVAAPRRVTFIDGLRGLAALCVACHHLDGYRPYPPESESIIPHWGNVLLEHGWIGVQIFFVISGFVIAYSLRRATITPAYAARFTASRWLRLAPGYLAIIAVVLAMEWAAPFLGIAGPSREPVTAGLVVTHLVYLHQILGHQSLSLGFWTLCVEMQFYVGFAVLLGFAQWLATRLPAAASRWRGLHLMITFAPLSLVSLFCFNIDPRFDDWLMYHLWLFFIGMLVWWVVDGKLAEGWLWAFAACVVIRLAWVYNLRGVVGLVTGVAILLAYRNARFGKLLDARPIQYLGLISYSLYLVHYSVNHLVVEYGFRLTGDGKGPEALWYATSLGLSIFAAHWFYKLVEKPSLTLAARVKQGATATPARPPLPQPVPLPTLQPAAGG
jgi:peptidoglycan/LPS O-acetylase OafA/YrhL